LGFLGFCRLLRFDFLRYLKVIIGSVPEYVTSCFICSFPSSLLLHHANQLQGSLFEGQAGKALHRPVFNRLYMYWFLFVTQLLTPYWSNLNKTDPISQILTPYRSNLNKTDPISKQFGQDGPHIEYFVPISRKCIFVSKASTRYHI
jgi:hypothetical protein